MHAMSVAYPMTTRYKVRVMVRLTYYYCIKVELSGLTVNHGKGDTGDGGKASGTSPVCLAD
ncbi:hypothetical protein BCON_0001g01050 [Botryotinia convoluta]|uniref:Uncharacterized protein n=1 Tax=Botryotinia convoluta TaxID=54673 RepID=A0A4Z1IWF3_9HELO|nr:hypothetical protein BCON_0001g01050 [Botryotinia convoluta]